MTSNRSLGRSEYQILLRDARALYAETARGREPEEFLAEFMHIHSIDPDTPFGQMFLKASMTRPKALELPYRRRFAFREDAVRFLENNFLEYDDRLGWISEDGKLGAIVEFSSRTRFPWCLTIYQRSNR